MRVFPADAIIVNRNAPVPAWVIVVAIIAALIVIAVIAGALWGVSVCVCVCGGGGSVCVCVLFNQVCIILYKCTVVVMDQTHPLTPSHPHPLTPSHTPSQLGFFRRKKHEELKKQKEDLQNLNDFGSSQENIIKPE